MLYEPIVQISLRINREQPITVASNIRIREEQHSDNLNSFLIEIGCAKKKVGL